MSDIEIVVEFDDSPDEEIFLEAPPENEGGVPGPPGPQGKSAYQVAVANGFVGTEAQWLASLKGEPGADGVDGIDGAPGVDGEDGADGAPGAPGANGLSAYQVAVANGFVGTEAQWLVSLKGEPGADGTDGIDGAPGVDGEDGSDGAPGAPGANGLSAYQVAVVNGFVGTEAQWLASLKGTDGADGTDGAPGAKGDKGDPGDPAPAVVFFRSPLYAEDFLNDPTTTINPWTGASVGTGGTASTAPSATHYDGNRQGILLGRSSANANSGYRYMTGLSKIRLKGGEIARFVVCPSSGSNLSLFRVGFQDSNTNADPVDGCWFTVTSTGLVTAYCASNSSLSNQPFANIDPAQWYFFFINVVSPTSVVFSIVSMAGTLIETKTITTNIPTDAGRQTGHGFVAWNTGTNAHDVINIDYMDMQFGSLVRG